MVRSIANIAPLSISDSEVRFGNVRKSFLHDFPATGTHGFVKSGVDFVRHTMRQGSINDGFVEVEYRIGLAFEVSRQFGIVGIEAYAEIGLLRKNLFYQLLSGHAEKFRQM